MKIIQKLVPRNSEKVEFKHVQIDLVKAQKSSIYRDEKWNFHILWIET